jgi:VWFA-related protein
MALALVLALALGLSAQSGPDRSAEKIVHVHATVSDEHGRSIEDLGPGDFELIEEDTPRSIEAARFIRTSGAGIPGGEFPEIRSRADEQAEAAREGTRLFALLLDEYHVAPGPATDRVRDALSRLVADHLGPRDLVVVFKPLDSLLSIRLTRNRDEIARAIATFEGRKGEYQPRNAFEKNFLAADPERIEMMRRQISMAALNGLVAHLGGLDAGRKALVLVSEGFHPRERTPGEARPTLEAVARAAHRAAVSIFPIDPRSSGEATSVRPAATTEAAAEGATASTAREALRELARATEGRAIEGAEDADDLDAGLQRMVRDVSGYYLLTFRSSVEPDGAFHPVRVRVTRPGAEVRASRGHWAASPADLYGASLASAESAPPEPLRRTSLLIRPWFGIARGVDGQSRVSFVWEPAPRVPGTPARTATPARVALTVLAADGTAVFEGVVTPVVPGSGADSRAVFHAPPGRLRVEMRVEDEEARRLDTDVRDVSVGPLAGPMALGTAQVFRARTAREWRALEGNPEAVPVASREFSRGEQLLVRVPVYAAGRSPALAAALVSGLGGMMRSLPVAVRPGTDLQQVEVPLAGLVAGEYRLELTAEDAGVAAKEVVVFRVTP